MKTKFRSEEIAHVWYHANAPRGESPGSMSFEGDCFYSYNTVIGRKLSHKGKSAVLLNDNRFSVTTAKHEGRMRQAIPHGITLFHVAEGMGARLNHSPLQLFEYAVSRSADKMENAAKSKHKGYIARMEGEAGYWLEEARKVAEFFGIKRKVDSGTVARLNASRVREEKRKAKAEAARQEAARREALSDFEAWKAGADINRHFGMFPVAFRVEGDELVSSLGARVPVREAKIALRFVQSHKGQEWRENGETCPVGGYRVNAISPVGVVAGCHRIAWDEVQHVAELLA